MMLIKKLKDGARLVTNYNISNEFKNTSITIKMKATYLISFAISLILMICIASGSLAQKEISNGLGTIKAELLTVAPKMADAKAVKFDYNSTDYMFNEGVCALEKNNLWGFIDTLGNWVIEPKYFEWAAAKPVFSGGICLLAIKAADGYGNVPIYIDKNGNQLFKNQSFVAASPFSDGIAVVGKKTGPGKPTLYSFINTQGVAIVGAVIPKFNGYTFGFGPYGNGLTKMWDDKLSSYGFIDNKGKWVIKPELKKWGEAAEFSDDRCAVQNTINFYWGYIDKSGATKVQFDYREKPNKFSSGRALVKNSSKYTAGYLDKEGNMALDFKYTFNSFDFYNGYAVVTIDNQQLTRAIIDVNGNIVKELNTIHDPIINSDGTIVYSPRNQDGLQMLNPDGSVIFSDAMYQKINAFSDDRAYVEFYDGGSQSGFINRKGELVIVRKD